MNSDVGASPLSLLRMALQESSMVKSGKSESKDQMVTALIKILHGPLTLCKTWTPSYMTVFSGTQKRKTNISGNILTLLKTKTSMTRE